MQNQNDIKSIIIIRKQLKIIKALCLKIIHHYNPPKINSRSNCLGSADPWIGLH